MTKPLQTFRAGAIAATIWENHVAKKDGSVGVFNTISLERSYKDTEDRWQSTASLRLADLPKAQLVLWKAYEYLVLKRQDSTTLHTLSTDAGNIPAIA
jgi:hypothetical protein